LQDSKSRTVLLQHIEFNLTLDPARAPVSEPPFSSLLRGFEHDLFVDGGAFDGDTVVRYFATCPDSSAKVLALEPDRRNLAAMEKRISALPVELRARVECVAAALWSEVGEVSFSSEGNPSSGVNDEGGGRVAAVTVDALVAPGIKAFIKLDVEGAEAKALEGGSRTLAAGDCALGVSLYHRVDDPVLLVRQVLASGPYSGISLRAHGENSADLMAYAFPD
jgi:FkbM family methyltransferase